MLIVHNSRQLNTQWELESSRMPFYRQSVPVKQHPSRGVRVRGVEPMEDPKLLVHPVSQTGRKGGFEKQQAELVRSYWFRGSRP
ncbi:MAG: hypothetical protein RLY14_2539 [Planctomycetota bacterium]